MINPTGKPIRNDRGGDGHFGAKRGDRIHKGIDFECDPGQPVKAVISGKLTRVVYPYSGGFRYMGVEIANSLFIVHLLYVTPEFGLIGTGVNQGDVIGYAQDISLKYSKVEPHIHVNTYLNIEGLL